MQEQQQASWLNRQKDEQQLQKCNQQKNQGKDITYIPYCLADKYCLGGTEQNHCSNVENHWLSALSALISNAVITGELRNWFTNEMQVQFNGVWKDVESAITEIEFVLS